MNTSKKGKITPICFLLALMLLAGCNKESATFKFLAQSEIPQTGDGSKTRLVNESLVYWEVGDTIDAWRVGGSGKLQLVFSGFESNPKALFEPQNSEAKFGGSGNVFFTLFPHNDGNSFGPTPTIVFPAQQKYVDDYTFGKTACPMVAYGGEVDDAGVVRMLFHNLCGIVRIQLRNEASTASEVTLQHVQFISGGGNLPLSGKFAVRDYDKSNPYVEPASSGTSNTVTISNINRTIGNDLLTFYLVLPAGQAATPYRLTMLVSAVSGSERLYLSKQFTVNIRRNGITKMPSLTIDSWSADESGSGGTTSVGLSGNGTPSRPFLIYTVDDLLKVRYAFNKTNPINGVDVNANACTFKIMRSDIVLDNSVWDEGIKNFKGTMIYGANQTGTIGVRNNTKVPIFESIGANGVVENLTVWGSHEWTDNDGTPFSPLCNVNHGHIVNCRLSDNASYAMTTSSSNDVGMAGICVTTFPTSHDVADPMGFRFECGDDALGYCTDTGLLPEPALAALAGGCEVVAIPETTTSIERIVADLRRFKALGKRSIIMIVAEGDSLGGSSEVMTALKEKGCPFEMRNVVLGHVQRGGSPCPADRVLATKLGCFAVDALHQGETGKMAGMVSGQFVLTPLDEVVQGHRRVAEEVEKLIDRMSI